MGEPAGAPTDGFPPGGPRTVSRAAWEGGDGVPKPQIVLALRSAQKASYLLMFLAIMSPLIVLTIAVRGLLPAVNAAAASAAVGLALFVLRGGDRLGLTVDGVLVGTRFRQTFTSWADVNEIETQRILGARNPVIRGLAFSVRAFAPLDGPATFGDAEFDEKLAMIRAYWYDHRPT
ncbi:MAG: hypothetical protein R2726_14305 [Acidimicrobiales bacterium]